ncbi:uncharacterized protein LOC133525287 [Cydia pomonella]|uniref:uncharacterized protein LOC133525287 n=1 Tax=Cydia pomonella TaxID=82600 RepID=UPI002ADDC852|nr:uncharacterized protein LOC133525287 [Cydia pomonella]
MNKLSALISRKEQLLKQREALQRRQQIDFKDGSNSDIVEESDTEMFPKISTSNDSINTSTICLPLDHSFFRPYSGDELNHASTNNINPNASPTTPLQEDKENSISEFFQGSDSLWDMRSHRRPDATEARAGGAHV